MKIYTIRAKQKQRKYHEEQIHYLLDGSPEYNWRKVQKEIKECIELESLPSNRTFITDKVEFLDLEKYGWLKSDYRLPILNNKLIDFITSNSDFEFRIFPITIQNHKNKSDKNESFSAFFIKEYLELILSILYSLRLKEYQLPICTSQTR